MFPRRGWLWTALLCFGCHTLPALELSEATKAAGQLWEKGQAAMRSGQPDAAIEYYKRSLQADAGYSSSHLSLAAAYLEKQNPAEACFHLGRYLEANPDQLMVRIRYGELLMRRQRLPEARVQFEQSVTFAQDLDEPAPKELVLCHSQLVAIAANTRDAYGEHLHRGIGLFLLARQRLSLPDPDGEVSVEALLLKAAAELTLARIERPEEARPCWYLYRIWSQLGQRQPALCRLRESIAAAPFSYLTPAERRDLDTAQEELRMENERPA